MTQKTDPALFVNPYTRWGHGLTALGALLLVAGTGGTFLPFGLRLVGGAVLGSLTLTLGIATWITAQSVEAELTRWRNGEHLARWDIPRDRYLAWRAAQRAIAAKVGAAVAATVALGGLVFAALLYYDAHEVEHAQLALIGSLIAGLVLQPAVAALQTGPQAPGDGPVPLVIGPHGAWFGGAMLRWRGFGFTFTQATYVDDPPTLRVQFTVRVKNGEVPHTLDLPVPAQRVEDAQVVVALISDEGATLTRT